MSKLSVAIGKRKQDEKRLAIRNQVWGDEIESLSLWEKEVYKGFASVPRTLPQLSRIMDKFSGKGFPVSTTYLSLLCNVFSHSFIEIKEKKRFAFESGFSGQRALTAWHGRMRKLESMGFIKSKLGMYDEFSYVLILDPFHAVEELYKDMEKDELYYGLISRMSDVGTVV
ncbi:hypothetical protein M0K80_RS21890 [Providencia rettgeri]|nr:hypothetical protein [Providencia rettgeri]ELR5242222.1 hypothetical protein [Providencia rettgeri]